MSAGPFIVAEIGANHLGLYGKALSLIDAAAKAGADAVKLQTFTPEQMAAPGKVIEEGPWAGRELLQLYRETHTPREWHEALFRHAKAQSLIVFASVFHPDDVDFLETLDCPIYKIASFEILDTKLIRHAAGTGKPLVISTGMATLGEIALAVHAAKQAGCRDLTVLKCTSAYPADCSEANLGAMSEIRRTLDAHKVGLSDHTPGSAVAVAATALGATMIEKHLTMSRRWGGPDAAFSMEPDEFAVMVSDCRRAAQAVLGDQIGPTAGERAHLSLRRKPGGKRGEA